MTFKKIWSKELDPSESYSDAARERLAAKLREYQKDNAQIVGSVLLFSEFLKEPNWIIWRDPSASQLDEWRKKAGLPDDAEFAKDPLQALTDERELKEEIKHLAEPIRLTPADAQHSRRQFYFSDATKFTERGEYRHEPNQRTVLVPLAMRDNGILRQTRVRLHYSAPRLLREGLRTDVGENLGAAPWLQPMMAALGLKEPMPQDFRGCAVALMPDFTALGERRILLNFPLTLDPEALIKQLGKAARWDNYQFGGADGESYWLRWPSTWATKAKSKPWWESGESFRCLSVDLGQRDAGAFALLEASAGNAPKLESRKIGEAGGKTWWSTVKATGTLRLPGEDARVLRGGQWQEEFSGDRGRNLVAGEWEEACDICTKLGLDPGKVLGDEPQRYSFPELNDRLLFALRRAQTRLARLQSWSCIATDEKRRTSIAEQIREADDDPLELKPLEAKQSWDLIAAKLIAELEKERATIPGELLRIADRIQPLRGRRWEWARRDDGSNCYVLRQTSRKTDPRKILLAGQRGLSIKRIEQLESLRQRCQSLNRALMQIPGQPAKLGRSKRGIELPDPCPELLDRLEKLKEQRVNQTAHLILAQALGVRLRAHEHDDATREHRDIHGEYEKFREPVDFLVLEDLNRYLASQGRNRGENSRLMKWCHRQILGKLKQLCEPYGMRVLETPAAYSSRFCSLTGVAGFRAVELTPEHAREFRWEKHLKRLSDPERSKKLNKAEREESQRVKALFDNLEKLNADLQKNNSARPKWRTLLAPVAGGPIFIPASEMEWVREANTKTGKLEHKLKFKKIADRRPVIAQSDINAAINLGLRAIAAPDVVDIHLRIRAQRDTATFAVRAENLREKARWGTKPPKITVPDAAHREKLLADARLNFFADLGGVAEFDLAEIFGNNCYASGRGIWGSIKGNEWRSGKDWQRVEELNHARICKFKRGDDDVPM